VSKELSGKDHEWLKALTRDAQKEDIRTFLNSAKLLHGKYERTLLDSVLQVAIQANQGKYIEVKEDVEKMSDAYQILFAKEIKEAEKEREQLTAQIEAVQEQRDQEKKEREQLTAQIEAVQEQRDELTAERDQARAEADMLRKELERMKAQLAGTNT
jgi:septal ring factor EnvC (AmiA/AmiB activator)